MVRCPTCNEIVPGSRKTCWKCGMPMPKVSRGGTQTMGHKATGVVYWCIGMAITLVGLIGIYSVKEEQYIGDVAITTYPLIWLTLPLLLVGTFFAWLGVMEYKKG